MRGVLKFHYMIPLILFLAGMFIIGLALYIFYINYRGGGAKDPNLECGSRKKVSGVVFQDQSHIQSNDNVCAISKNDHDVDTTNVLPRQDSDVVKQGLLTIQNLTHNASSESLNTELYSGDFVNTNSELSNARLEILTESSIHSAP